MVPPPRVPQSTADGSTILTITIEGIPDTYLYESSIESVTLVESLLTPSIHATVHVQDSIYWAPDGKVKDLNILKGQNLVLNLFKKDRQLDLTASLPIYRIDNRKMMNMQIESYNINAIDSDALVNASSRVAKQWVCQTPKTVVEEILNNMGAAHVVMENNISPKRNYSATNIHPYQVLGEQAEVALANGTDPSFLHFMTFENITGTHHFRSIANMATSGTIASYVWNEKGTTEAGFGNPWSIMSFEFPCDFDLLSDLMNGVNNSSAIIENIQNGTLSLFGKQDSKSGIGAGLTKYGMTDYDTNSDCNVNVEKYLHLRQARMSLLEQDKIGLRMTVPFNPELHVGMVVNVKFTTKDDVSLGQLEYGSGDYMICSMSHVYKAGGFCTTTLDCVSETVATGVL